METARARKQKEKHFRQTDFSARWKVSLFFEVSCRITGRKCVSVNVNSLFHVITYETNTVFIGSLVALSQHFVKLLHYNID